MNPDRTTVLSQLANGQISAEQAATQLRETPRPAPANPGSFAGRWMHIHITDLATGRSKVKVNLPLSWVEVGLKLGARYSPEISDFDWQTILESIRSGANGKIVEVEELEDGERVEISVD